MFLLRNKMFCYILPKTIIILEKSLTATYIIILIIATIIIGYFLFQPTLLKNRRLTIKAHDFPKEWERILSAHWPLYCRLPDLLKQNLHDRIKLFLSEKQFIACNDFKLDEKHKLLISAQACLLIINKPFEYFDKLKTILVYPSAFIVRHNNLLANGTVSEDTNINSGEAWETGKIILSWDDAYSGMIKLEDGHNVVIHEFAHLLDHTNGTANGAPLLQHAKSYDQWSQIFSSAYENLQRSINIGQSNLFNPYGATNPGEFFAVASELFFEKSKSLQQHEPELHQQLTKFYAIDPTLW